MDKQLLVNGELYLFGDVGDPWGWGDGFTPNDVVNALAEHGDADITARINSGGGIATDGAAIYSLLKSHPGKVTMIVDGVAASAASLIAMAGDIRQMRDGAMLMIHDPATITVGNMEEHQKAASRLDKLADNYAGIYARASAKSVSAAREIMKAETWLTADEAMREGFITAKLDEAAKEKAAFDYSIYLRAPRTLPVRTKRVGDRETVAHVTAPSASQAAARMRMRQAGSL